MPMYGLKTIHIPCDHLWIVDHIVHLWNDVALWIDSLELRVMRLNLETQVCDYDVITYWCKDVVNNVHQKEEILPVLIILWYEISYQERKVSPQTPHL